MIDGLMCGGVTREDLPLFSVVRPLIECLSKRDCVSSSTPLDF